MTTATTTPTTTATTTPTFPVWPADVRGWLHPSEGTALYYLSRGGVILEVGSYEGLSTICMAQAARRIVAVDTFETTNTPGGGSTLEAFRANLKRYRVTPRVEIRQGFNEKVLPQLAAEGMCFDGAFLDSSHDRASVQRDLRLILPLVRPSGWIAFHDYGSVYDPDVEPVVEEWRGERWLVRVGNLAVLPCNHFA